MKWQLTASAVLLSAMILVYAFWSADPRAEYFGGAVQMLMLGYSAISLTRTSVANPSASRKPWTRLAIGAWIWVLAQIMEVCEIALGQPAYGTLADGFWIFGYFPLLGGLHEFTRNFQTIQLPKSTAVVSGSACAALFCCLFYFLILPQLLDIERNIFSKLLDLAYPVFDFLLLAAAIVMLLKSKVSNAPLLRSFRFMSVGFLLLLIADIGLSLTSTEDSLLYLILDVPYFGSYCMLALAAKTIPSGGWASLPAN